MAAGVFFCACGLAYSSVVAVTVYFFASREDLESTNLSHRGTEDTERRDKDFCRRGPCCRPHKRNLLGVLCASVVQKLWLRLQAAPSSTRGVRQVEIAAMAGREKCATPADGAQKNTRKQRVPGGQRTSATSGAIGSLSPAGQQVRRDNRHLPKTGQGGFPRFFVFLKGPVSVAGSLREPVDCGSACQAVCERPCGAKCLRLAQYQTPLIGKIYN